MPHYTLSNRAANEIREIAGFTANRWGSGQAQSYIFGLHAALGRLADNPLLGQRIDHVRKGHFRFRYRQHPILYEIGDDGVFVSRVLHVRMDLRRHLAEDASRG